MRFPYSRFIVRGTAPNTHALAFRPMVDVRIIGPDGAWDVSGRVDTGADDTIVPDRLAAILGVAELTPPILISGIGGGVTARYGTVDLEISEGQTSYRWSAWIGFSALPDAVYGIKGFLIYFEATFNGHGRYLDLEPQGHAPPPVSTVP